MYKPSELSSKSLKELKEIADRLDAEPQGHAGRKISWVWGILTAQKTKQDTIGGLNTSIIPSPEENIEESENSKNLLGNEVESQKSVEKPSMDEATSPTPLDPFQSLRELAKSKEQQRKDKTLFLILKKEWYDAIASGQKKEEYREITPYWQKRLEGKDYDHVLFQLGYKSDAPRRVVPLLGIEKGYPKPQWAPPEWHNKECYVLKLQSETEAEFLDKKLTEWLESNLREVYGEGDQAVWYFQKDFIGDCKDYFYRFGGCVPSDVTKIQEWIDTQDWRVLFESSPTTGKSRFIEKLIQAWDEKEQVVDRGNIADFCSVIASPFIKSDQKIENWSSEQAWRSILETFDWYDCEVFDVNESKTDADADDEVLIEALEKATKITESLREQLFEIFDFDTDFNLIASKQEAYRQKMAEAYLKASATK